MVEFSNLVTNTGIKGMKKIQNFSSVTKIMSAMPKSTGTRGVNNTIYIKISEFSLRAKVKLPKRFKHFVKNGIRLAAGLHSCGMSNYNYT